MSVLGGINLKDHSGCQIPLVGSPSPGRGGPADLSAVAIRGATLTSSKEVKDDGTNTMRVLRIVS